MIGVLHEDEGAPRVGGNALDLVKQLAGILALVDAAACAKEDRPGPDGIDDDRKDVGVFNDALFDVLPVLAAVRGLPGQMPGSGIDDVRVRRVDGKRLDPCISVLPGGLIWVQDAPESFERKTPSRVPA